MVTSYYCPVADINNKDAYCPDPTKCQPPVDYHNAINYSEVDFNGVKSVLMVCDGNGNMKIIQANGYTDERGEFSDSY